MRKPRLLGSIAIAAVTVGSTCAVIAPPASAAVPGAPTLVSSSGSGSGLCSSYPAVHVDWAPPAGASPAIDGYNYTITSGATTIYSGSLEDYYTSQTWSVPAPGAYTVTITAHNADGSGAPLSVPVTAAAPRVKDAVAPTLGAMSFGATTVIVTGTAQIPVTLDVAASDNTGVDVYYSSGLWGPGVTYDAVNDDVNYADDGLQHMAWSQFSYRKSGTKASGVTQQTFVFDPENKPANGLWSLSEVSLVDSTKVGDEWCSDNYYDFTRRTKQIADNPTYNKALPSTPSFFLTDVNLPGIGAPKIKGKAKAGKKLHAVAQPPAGVAVTYQWYVTKGKKAKTKLIGTGAVIKLKKKFKGSKISVTATYTAPGGASYLIAGKGKKVK